MINGGWGLEGLVQHLKTLAAIGALCIIDSSVCMMRPSVWGGGGSLFSERVNKLQLKIKVVSQTFDEWTRSF